MSAILIFLGTEKQFKLRRIKSVILCPNFPLKYVWEAKQQTVDLSSLTPTNNSVGIKKEISAGNNPASNPTPSLYWKLTEDQKLRKLKDVMDQIHKEGKYYWIFHTEFNNVGKSVYSFAISIRDEMENNPEQSIVIMCRESTTLIYYFNCKDVDKDLLEQIVPLIHHIPTLLFFNINHMTSKDIDILDSVFSEYFMSNDTTTLYQAQILFYPEWGEDECIYELSKSSILLYFINKLSENFIKDRVSIIIRFMKFTNDKLIVFLLFLQLPRISFWDCLILKFKN